MSHRILIVDYDLDHLAETKSLFETHQFEVMTATNGEIALKAFEQEKPDLVLMAAMLPKKSGFEVCQEIREKNPNTPILLLSDIYKGTQYRNRAISECGASAFLELPLSLEEILNQVNSTLGRSPSVEEEAPPPSRSPASPPVEEQSATDADEVEKAPTLPAGGADTSRADGDTASKQHQFTGGLSADQLFQKVKHTVEHSTSSAQDEPQSIQPDELGLKEELEEVISTLGQDVEVDDKPAVSPPEQPVETTEVDEPPTAPPHRPREPRRRQDVEELVNQRLQSLFTETGRSPEKRAPRPAARPPSRPEPPEPAKPTESFEPPEPPTPATHEDDGSRLKSHGEAIFSKPARIGIALGSLLVFGVLFLRLLLPTSSSGDIQEPDENSSGTSPLSSSLSGSQKEPVLDREEERLEERASPPEAPEFLEEKVDRGEEASLGTMEDDFFFPELGPEEDLENEESPSAEPKPLDENGEETPDDEASDSANAENSRG